MSTVTTVRGDIQPEELGYTTMHEHLNTSFALMADLMKRYGAPTIPQSLLQLRPDNLAFLRDGGYAASEECWTKGDVDYTVTELDYFKQIGGKAVVDASPIGLRGDVRELRAASERSDVHVVFATGLYVADARPAEYAGWSEETQLAFFAAEVTDGVTGTGIRPGILKCALSTTDPTAALNEVELSTLRALGRLSVETGLSVHVHTAFPMSAAQVLQGVEVALATGMDPDRLVMIHLDSFLRPWGTLDRYVADMDVALNVSTQLHRDVLGYGVNIGFDSWSSTVNLLPSDDDRLKGLVDLIRAGHGSRIVLGHDNATKSHGKSYGYYGFTKFGQFIPPLLTQLGFGDEVYRALVVDNPARILAH